MIFRPLGMNLPLMLKILSRNALRNTKNQFLVLVILGYFFLISVTK